MMMMMMMMMMTILKMEAADSSKIWVHLYQTPQRRIHKKKINRPPHVYRKCYYGKWFHLANFCHYATLDNSA